MKKTLLHFIIAFVFINMSLVPVSAQNCLVSGYELDGDATDYTSNGNDGTVNGAVGTADRNANPNAAMNLDGVDDYIELPTDFDFKRRTINLWFYADSVFITQGQQMYGSDHPNLSWGSTFLIAGIDNNQQNDTILRYMVGADPNGEHEEPINPGQWYMATIVVDSNVTYYYLDCQFLVSKTNTFNSSQGATTSNATLGTDRNYSAFFDGKIDHLKVYDCALSSNDICDIYTTDVKEVLGSSASFSVYPNPASQNFTVTYEGYEHADKVLIQNVTGQVVYKDKLNDDQQKTEINREFINGMYFISLYSSGGRKIASEKLIVR